MRERAEALIAAYDIRCQSEASPARLLSGGNIQKIVLARTLETEPKVVLAAQPSRGLDVGATSDVHKRLLAARERGAGVILISEDLDELMRLSDRIAVIHRGHLSAADPTETSTAARLACAWPDMAARRRHDPVRTKRPRSRFTHAMAVSVAAAVAALLLAAIPMAFAGLSVFEAYGLMVKGAFGSVFAFTEMLTRATPLILTGLAAAVAFRAKLWNIGAEGQLYAGALAAVAVGTGLVSGPRPTF